MLGLNPIYARAARYPQREIEPAFARYLREEYLGGAALADFQPRGANGRAARDGKAPGIRRAMIAIARRLRGGPQRDAPEGAAEALLEGLDQAGAR